MLLINLGHGQIVHSENYCFLSVRLASTHEEKKTPNNFLIRLVLLIKGFLVTYVTGAQILTNPWVWNNHNKRGMIKMRN